MSRPEKTRIAIVGNGIIGHGVAEVFATAGYDVVLIGRNESSLSAALDKISASIDEFVERGLLPEGSSSAARARVATSTDLAAAAGAGFVVEALPEDMALKIATFARLDQLCDASAVLATASGHPASEVAAEVKHSERLIAAHFWYPPQLLPLVEVCGAPTTSAEVVERTCDLLRAVGKEPVVIDREIDGFIGNRLQFALLREAWTLWADGVASATAIDAVVRHSIGRRLGITGPIESADLGGIQTMVSFAQFLQPHLSTAPQPPAKIAAVASTADSSERTGVHELDASAASGLLRARRDELFRWLADDRARAGLGQ
ncbi:MAG: 3-hydroxybutyryl-CoA dehydrogenase [Pseudonocardiales bacterium]|jgi:3-hydroxybutyryl-CoA dehydrogenase|nr:3-hydroxybutyryl-CoA dehydrogenase [Pseudonocardiales bacterium]